MKVAIASDHAGFPLKDHLRAYLEQQGHEVLDLGTDTPDVPTDYPDHAAAIAQAVLDGRAERGILACGSGVGASVAANKFDGIYAGLTHDTYSAAQGVEHDRMNVLCVGARVIGVKVAESLADAFLGAVPNDEARFARRFNKLLDIEKQQRG